MGAAAASAGPMIGGREEGTGSRLRQIVGFLLGILVSGVAAAFFAINDYSSSTATAVGFAQRSSERFEAVYSDSADTKLAALRLGVDLVLVNPEITGAFAREDRDGLSKLALPLFETVLKAKYGLNQFNFWTPPAKLFLRSGNPKEFGTDGSTARASVVLSNERRAPVSGMETGLGGRLGIRAMAPILDGTRLVGVVELGDDLIALLRRARNATGVEFAAGLDRKRSDDVERAPDKAKDAIQGTDVFFEYSSDEIARLVKTVKFNSRDPAVQLATGDGRAILTRSFSINNFAGTPTVVVATVFDLTSQFHEARQSALIKGGILFVVLAIAAILSLMQFQKLQRGFSRIVFGERRKLEDTTRALEAAQAKLRDVNAAKLGYFTNLVAATTEPLQAISGQLSTALPKVEAGLSGSPTLDAKTAQDLLGRLRFSLSEIGRLTRMMTDFRHLEVVRQHLGKTTSTVVQLGDVVNAVMENELARFRRLPDLTIRAEVPQTLPAVRVSRELMNWTVTGLVSYAAQKGGQGTIDIVGSLDEAGWVRLAVTGSAFRAAGAPTEALIDDTRQFISRLSDPTYRASEENGLMMALVLARTIIEKAGGRIDAASTGDGEPGFVLRLPAAT